MLAMARYAVPMQPKNYALPLMFLSLVTASVAHARGTIDKVEIKGLDKGDDAEMIENIEVSLSLYDTIGKPQGESRLEYLLSQAERQTREALEPFGYYNPVIKVDSPREGENLRVVIQVDKGPPTLVRREHIDITGPAQLDQYLQEDLEKFKPRKGQRFEHTQYEASKITVTRRLAERGYFDADYTQRQVQVTRADNAADIDLTWDSGRRYNMGDIRFHQDYFVDKLFDPLVYWEKGSYFHEGKLDRLRESLTKLDYFSVIDIQPRPDQADANGDVPVDVNLTRAKRSIYTAGLSYGSESGAGVRGGLERRFLNNRGHKMNTQLDYAQKRKSLVTATAFRPSPGWMAGTPSPPVPTMSRPITSTCATSSCRPAAAVKSTSTGRRSPRSTRCASVGATRRAPSSTMRSTPPRPWSTRSWWPTTSTWTTSCSAPRHQWQRDAAWWRGRRGLGHQLRAGQHGAALVRADRRQRPPDPARRRRHHLDQ